MTEDSGFNITSPLVAALPVQTLSDLYERGRALCGSPEMLDEFLRLCLTRKLVIIHRDKPNSSFMGVTP